MRLAATLTTLAPATERGADRQPVTLRGTLRDLSDAPLEIVVLDVSESGFLAELPGTLALNPGAEVRIAATPLGIHNAVVVRRDGRLHGFAFANTLRGDMLANLDGEQPSTVMPFPGRVVPASDVEPGKLSARASLALMVAISLGLWLTLAGLVFAASYFI